MGGALCSGTTALFRFRLESGLRASSESSLTLHSLRSPQLTETNCIIPNLGHVLDPVAVKLHSVDVVGRHGISIRFSGRPGPVLRSMKHCEGGYAVSLRIRRKKLQLVMSIRNRSEKGFHPLSVPFERLDVGEGIGL